MKRVLIAEDDPSILLSLEFLLSQAGYEVCTAKNGADALALAGAEIPDLLVLDIMLPGIDGFEICRSLRAHPASSGLLILMLTARGREHEVTRGLALGANAYLTKPFATRELLRVVRELLGGEPGS
ncbi:MAG TPA: response regulator [Burkholderiales bacterium]|nr:response regulator [Burkholderiales bacterium]